ncbi:MAG: HAD family phosphatase [Candidatus Marinimicrobia bacterium]|nr:HAD family phosphatase [Candidatus Neomarinimicrobiota bacterium]
MKPNKIKAFFFDIGGVLVRVNPNVAIQKISKRLQISAEQIQQAMSAELLNTYEKGHLSSNQFYEQLLINYGSSRNISLETFKTYWEDMLFPNKEGIDFLKRASKDFPVWLLSNTNDFHYDILMQHFPFMQWVKGGTYSFMVGSMKPQPFIYQQAIRKSGFRPEEILFIDDLPINVQAAQEQGLHAIQYNDHAGFCNELSASFPNLEYLI